jgi:hypothetical protein
MAINSSPSWQGPKITNKVINDVVGVDHTNRPGTMREVRRVGHYAGDDCKGLFDPEIQQVIKSLARPWGDYHYADFMENPGVEYAAFIYPLVESRLPVILAIDGPGVSHVVAVLGHTINSDRWEPEARQGYGAYPLSPYISSAAWADHFIINDDNFGMYITLPREMVRNFLVPQYNPNLHASMAVGIVPAGVTLPGYLAEEMASLSARALIRHTQPAPANRWLQCLRRAVVKRDPRWNAIVCRTLLVDRKAYLSQLSLACDSEGHPVGQGDVQALQGLLPDVFWMTEVGLPDLYTANKTKLGDFLSLTQSSLEQYERGEGVIFAWLPGISRAGPGLSGPQQVWPFTGHIPLFRNGPAPLLEW